MKKYIVLIIFACMFDQSSVIASQEEQPQDQKIVVAQNQNNSIFKGLSRIVRPLAITYPLLIRIYSYHHYVTKPCGLEKYPYAQAWYQEKIREYPIANLEDSEFCQDKTWMNCGNRIFFPDQGLEEIDSIYRKKKSNQTLSDIDNKILNIHEFLLLHEASHRKHGDTNWVQNAYEGLQHTMTNAVLDYATDGSFAGIILAVGVNGLDKIHHSIKMEDYADTFACHSAKNSQVLTGGLQFFNSVTQSGFDKIDYLHPNSYVRAQKVVDERYRRWVRDNTCPAKK